MASDFERCDVCYGADPFKGDDYARPWLIISNEQHPFQGEQYVVLALTTRTWHDGFVRISEDEWIEGGTPKPSSIVPWSVETIERGDIEFRQGRIESSLVDGTVAELTDYLRSETVAR
ncbi:type II toxin-antitoxin system PemK/MazF family toxin [Natronococcus sp. A-GB7]|uniref:type II toxin-antitoxin system PemK/MazF family toxin n=1 Tax=Natronococcus sp. A-GB7 TaxID=3037649 RepID=UPI00241DD643|nr:type II toxin-antitoxin system PemK/MazF family toxin [Natronococcus sp. A-GB7]MDG5817418.1 type II toxin-antitoxin system PemK/MazF family toxin [Natronococcus sp. A-GB7]